VKALVIVSSARLLLLAACGALISGLLAGPAGVPINLIIGIPVCVIGIGATWLIARWTGLTKEDSSILVRQWSVRLMVIGAGPAGILLGALLLGLVFRVRFSGTTMGNVLDAATTFAMKRAEVWPAIAATCGWFFLSNILEVAVLFRSRSKPISRAQIVALSASSVVTILSALMWGFWHPGLIAS
jgi:hypothetical protein